MIHFCQGGAAIDFCPWLVIVRDAKRHFLRSLVPQCHLGACGGETASDAFGLLAVETEACYDGDLLKKACFKLCFLDFLSRTQHNSQHKLWACLLQRTITCLCSCSRNAILELLELKRSSGLLMVERLPRANRVFANKASVFRNIGSSYVLSEWTQQQEVANASAKSTMPIHNLSTMERRNTAVLQGIKTSF